MSVAWLNGSLVDEQTASVPVRDTGFLHAAGVFTTMRADSGTIVRLPRHLNRLRQSCDALSIPLQYRDDQLTSAAAEVLEKNQLQNARLRLTITGSGTCLLTATPLQTYPPELYERGMTVLLLDEQKLNPYDIQAGHKTLNYFSRLTSLRKAHQQSAGEAMWFNIYNYLQSGSISNVFLVKNGQLITPPTQAEIDSDAGLRERLPYARSNVLPGITRGAILELAAKLQIKTEFAGINVNQLLDADEVFLTNSIMDVMPVCRIERSVVGNDKPGEITLRLSEALKQLQD